jgi:hypothetical protein
MNIIFIYDKINYTQLWEENVTIVVKRERSTGGKYVKRGILFVVTVIGSSQVALFVEQN